MNIIVVFYAYLIGDWENILDKRLRRFITSGLYEEATEFIVVVTDHDNNPDKVRTFCSKFPKIKLEYHQNNNLYEYYALNKISDLASTYPKAGLMYFQLKGLTNISLRNFTKKTFSLEKMKCAESYLEMLQYILIDDWRKCVNKLQENFSIVGVNKINAQWYGNVWWASTDYLTNNKRFTFNPEEDSRWKCELWLMMDNPTHFLPQVKFYEFFSFWADNYYSTFPKSLYNGIDRNNLEFNIVKAYYGYFAEAQHELSPIKVDYNIMYDVTEDIVEFFKNCDKSKIYIKKSYEDIFNGNYKELDKRLKIYYQINTEPNIVHVMSSIPTTRERELGKIEI